MVMVAVGYRVSGNEGVSREHDADSSQSNLLKSPDGYGWNQLKPRVN